MQRLDRLARRSPWFVLMSVAAALGAALLLLTGAAKPKVPDEIVARRFTVVDTAGVPRAWITVDREGNPTVKLVGKSSAGDITLKASGDGSPALVFFESSGAPVRVSPSGLTLSDRLGVTRASLQAGADGSAALRLYQKDGKALASLAVPPQGAGALTFFGDDGVAKLVAGEKEGIYVLDLADARAHGEVAVRPDGSSSLVLSQDGKARASLSVQPDGPARVVLNDRHGRSRAWMTVLPGGSVETMPVSR